MLMLLRPLVCLGAWLIATNALAHSHTQKGIEIVHPWCFAPGESVGNTIVSLKIKNLSGRWDRLIRASSPVASNVEIRGLPGGEAKVRQRSGVEVKAGEEVTLSRTGPHLLLSGLSRQLSPYDSVPLTLVFERAGEIHIDVLVEEGP
jgi:copper(I)-binding protein